MILRPLDGLTCEKIVAALRQSEKSSRFVWRIDRRDTPKFKQVHLYEIRLKQAKDNCGQHPGPCILNSKPHRRRTTLEGLDWVGWNDGLNDICDKRGWSVDIWSYNIESTEGRFFIRRGVERRVRYDCSLRNEFGGLLWVTDPNSFENWCDRSAPRSVYPSGTPGIPAWSLRDEKRMRAQYGYEEEAPARKKKREAAQELDPQGRQALSGMLV